MKLSQINLNYYSFGYLGGFLKKSTSRMNAEELLEISMSLQLGGVEIPVDYLFNSDFRSFNAFMRIKKGCNVFISIENFNIDYIIAIIPELKKNNIHVARIKMSNYFGGNRYKNPIFNNSYSKFLIKLKKLRKFLINNNFKLLIENHQDLTSFDLLKIIDIFSDKYIGINWDIGNSLPSGETPQNFYKNIKAYIGNIHLKDYNILRCDKSLEYHRCTIGDGNIGFKNIFKYLLKDLYSGQMSIELGAYKKRVSDIFVDNFWKSYSYYDNSHRNNYINYINFMLSNKHIISEQFKPSKQLELNQIEKSVKNLKLLIKS